MMTKILGALAFSSLALPFSPSVLAQDARQTRFEEPVEETRVSRLADEIDVLTSAARIPGAAAAVVENGEVIWSAGYGVTRAQRGQRVNGQTVFQAASLSKPVFAHIVLRLSERGVIDLDKPLAAYLANERLEHDERYLTMTARHVLSHTSGLPNWGGTPLEMRRAPGGDFGYSGEGFLYLQAVAEHLTGETLESLARTEVFEPLGMNRSSFNWRGEFRHNVAIGTNWQGRPQPPRRRLDAFSAYSLLTTVEDYARFLAATLEGTGLDSTTFREMLTPQVGVAPDKHEGISWGLGWGLEFTERGTAVWHWGDNGGYHAFVIGYPETGEGLVYFANSSDGLSVIQPVVTTYFEGEHPAIDWLGYEAHDAIAFRTRKFLEQSLLEEGADGVELLRDARTNFPDDVNERFVNRLGYFLLGLDQFETAVAVFKENIEAHPDSWNVYDSMAEAHLMAGNFEKAVEFYQKSLALNPENENGTRHLEWIDGLPTVPDEAVDLSMRHRVSLSGDYGDWVVFLYGSVLVLSGPELLTRRKMEAVSATDFRVLGRNDMTAHFVMGENDRPTALKLRFAGGRELELERLARPRAG